MLQNHLHQIILIALCNLVCSNPYLFHNTYYKQSPALYYPQQKDNYHVSQSRQVQSYALPKWSSSNHHHKRNIQRQPQNYRVAWSYQLNNLHRWPTTTNSKFYGDQNQQVQSESYNRPIYRKQNQIKKSTGGTSYQKKIEFLENKKKKNEPFCKKLGEECNGWEPYIPENCCKGFVCDHTTKSIVGTCQKKSVSFQKSLTAKQSNIVQRPLTTEELLAGV